MHTNTIVLLFVLFQLKHFVADYPLQTQYMLGKFKDDGWEKPLLAHVGVHAVFTFLITCYFGVWHAVLFALFDAITHFVMDRFKADKRYLGRFTALSKDTYMSATDEQKRSNWWFWQAHGGDQLFHTLMNTIVVWWIAT